MSLLVTWVGKPLLCAMLWIIILSLSFSVCSSGYVFSLLVKYLRAANLCWVGWHEL
jgi:hypothetical protein